MKKYYVLIVVLVLILALLNIPDLSVFAAESDDIYFNDIFIGLGDMRKFFDDADYRQNVQNAVDKGFNEGILLNCNDEFFNYDVNDEFTQDFYTFLSEPDNADNGFTGSSRNTCKLNVGRGFVQNMYPVFYDFLENPQNYKYFVYITRYTDASVGFYLYLVSSEFDGELSFISTDGGYIIPSEYYGSCTQLTFTLTYDTSQNFLIMNSNVTNNISPSEPFPMNAIITNSSYRCMYSDLNVYFTYRNKGYDMPSDIPTENYDTFPHIYNTLKTVNDYSRYIFDRREFTSGYSDNVTVDTDDPSKDFYGAWDIDLVPSGDLLNGQINFKFVPTNRLANVTSGFTIDYYYQLFVNTSSMNYNDVISWTGSEKNKIRKAICDAENLDYNDSAHVYSVWAYNLNGYFTAHTKHYTTSISNDYVSDSASNVLRDITAPQSYYSLTDAPSENIPMNSYNQMACYKALEMFTDSNKSGSGSISFGSVSAGISTSENSIKACTLTVYAQAKYNGKDFTDMACATYDYLTGNVTKQGTHSTVNNNYDGSNPPSGMTPKEYDEQTNKTIQYISDKGGVSNINKGGSVSGGSSNSSSTSTGGNVVNNNQDNIDIKSNWQYFVETNPDDNNPNDNVSAVDQFRQAYEIVTTPDNNPINSDVVQFLFTSDLWSIYPFNLIMGFSGLLVTVGIFTAILRLFRR